MSPELSPHIEALVFSSFHGELTHEQQHELSAWIAASPDNARFYYAYSLDERSIDRLLRGEHLGSVAQEQGVFEEIDVHGEGDAEEADSVWSQVVDDALAARRRRELEDEAERLLRADLAESRRLKMFERRRLAMDAKPAQSRALVIPKWAMLASAAAVGLAVVLALAGVFEPKPPAITHTPPAPQPTVVPRHQAEVGPKAVAVVDSALEARWATGAGPVSGELFPGDYELETGMVRVEYGHGVSLVVQAPARFRIDDDMHLALDLGRVSAVVPTAQGHGFTVTTPELEVVDLGTEFGVVAGGDGISEAHVYRGKVTTQVISAARRDARPTPLDAGQALRARGRDGAVVREQADELAVVRDSEYEVHTRAAEGSAYDRWLAWSMQMRRDPALRLYFAIDAEDRAAGELRNVAADDPAGLTGAMGDAASGWLAPRWSQGRWPEKPALHFERRRQSAVVVPTDPALHLGDTYTIACWVRFDADGHSHVLTRRAMADDGHLHDAINLVGIVGVNPHPTGHVDDSIFYHTGTTETANWATFCTNPVLRRDQGWVLITVVAEAGRIQTYFNGSEIDNRPQPAARLDNRQPLLLGASIAQPNDAMDGAIDEVVLLARAMTADEIRAMYDAGRPDPVGARGR